MSTTFITIYAVGAFIIFLWARPWKPTKSQRVVTIGNFVGAAIMATAVWWIILPLLLCDIKLYRE